MGNSSWLGVDDEGIIFKLVGAAVKTGCRWESRTYPGRSGGIIGSDSGANWRVIKSAAAGGK